MRVAFLDFLIYLFFLFQLLQKKSKQREERDFTIIIFILNKIKQPQTILPIKRYDLL